MAKHRKSLNPQTIATIKRGVEQYAANSLQMESPFGNERPSMSNELNGDGRPSVSRESSTMSTSVPSPITHNPYESRYNTLPYRDEDITPMTSEHMMRYAGFHSQNAAGSNSNSNNNTSNSSNSVTVRDEHIYNSELREVATVMTRASRRMAPPSSAQQNLRT